MSFLYEHIGCIIGGLNVINGYRGIDFNRKITKAIGICAADKRNIEDCRLFGGVVKTTAEENDAAEFLAASKCCASPQLILSGLYLNHLYAVTASGCRIFNYRNYFGKE